jgi:hypothetical protein
MNQMKQNGTKENDAAVTLESELAMFTGTTTYYRNFLELRYTEGVQYLAEHAGAYWLIDAIASWQPEIRKVEREFQLWELTVNDDHNAELTVRRDTGEATLAKQTIGYTDFPMNRMTLYVENNVLLLPSEH